MDCTTQLKLQLIIELECIEEDKEFFLSGHINPYLLVYSYVSFLDATMREMGLGIKKFFNISQRQILVS